jgi:hypothetical protein
MKTKQIKTVSTHPLIDDKRRIKIEKLKEQFPNLPIEVWKFKKYKPKGFLVEINSKIRKTVSQSKEFVNKLLSY